MKLQYREASHVLMQEQKPHNDIEEPWLALVICIWKVSGSNFGARFGYHNWDL